MLLVLAKSIVACSSNQNLELLKLVVVAAVQTLVVEVAFDSCPDTAA